MRRHQPISQTPCVALPNKQHASAPANLSDTMCSSLPNLLFLVRLPLARLFCLRGQPHVPGQAQGLQETDADVAGVDFVPLQAVPRRVCKGVVAVVPALTCRSTSERKECRHTTCRLAFCYCYCYCYCYCSLLLLLFCSIQKARQHDDWVLSGSKLARPDAECY